MITEISVTTKDLKDAGVLIPTTSPFDYLIWPVKKTDGSWRVRVNYCKLHQVVPTIAVGIPDVFFFL